MGTERGHRTLVITRKGGKVVTIPLAPRTARAIDLAIGERCEGPIFLATDERRLDRRGAGRIIRRVARQAGIAKKLDPTRSALACGQATDQHCQPPRCTRFANRRSAWQFGFRDVRQRRSRAGCSVREMSERQGSIACCGPALLSAHSGQPPTLALGLRAQASRAASSVDVCTPNSAPTCEPSPNPAASAAPSTAP
jgi:hypothetical protein